MPNYAYNELIFKSKEDFDKAVEKYTKDGDLDFNTIIPLPESLATMNGYMEDKHIKNITMYLINSCPELIKSSNEPGFILRFIKKLCYDTSLIDVKMVMKIQRYINDYKDKKINYTNEDINKGKKALYNIVQFGYFDWYKWSIDNWETKWNACECIINPKTLSIYWTTAWSPTVKIANEIAKSCKYPVYYRYAEEQFTEYVGEYLFNNDNVESYEYDASGTNTETMPMNPFLTALDLYGIPYWKCEILDNNHIKFLYDNEEEADEDDYEVFEGKQSELLTKFMNL